MEIKKLVIHVGMPKTGTSTIQATLVENAAGLLEQGILYPEFGRRFNAHHPYVDLLCEHRNASVPKEAISHADTVVELDRWREDPRVETIILSSEAFASGRAATPLLMDICLMFEIEVVCFFRHPIDYANSLANQVIKTQIFHGQKDTARIFADGPCFHRDYRDVVETWRAIAGESQVKVVALNKGRDAWSAFADMVDKRLKPFSSTSNKNSSLAGPALVFIDWIVRQERELGYDERRRFMSM